MHTSFTSYDVFNGSQDFRKVSECCVRNILLFAISDKIYLAVSILLTIQRRSENIPFPAFAKSKSVSFAAERSETPSPA